MIFLWFISLSVAEQPQGLVCQFTEPFYTLRYRFSSQLLTIEQLDLNTYKTTRTHLGTDQKADHTDPHHPIYVISIKGQVEPILTVNKDNKGSDGMSNEIYPFSAIYNGFHGGCSELLEIATHEVFGAANDKEPWLNLRSIAGTEGTIMGKIDDGVELIILEKDGAWRKVKVLSGYEEGRTGWVHSKWVQPLKPSPF